nr:SDR family oxidoreductase [Trinickia mobilis]
MYGVKLWRFVKKYSRGDFWNFFLLIAGQRHNYSGASSGMGKAATERFVQAGAKVANAGRTDVTEFANRIEATFFKTDVSVEADVRNLINSTVEKFGRSTS